MSDLAVMVAVVVAIYIFQCIQWSPARATVFRARFLGRGRRAGHGFAWNALGLVGFWANPFPVDALLVVNWPTASLNPEGLAPEGECAVIAWESATLRASGGKLRCNEFVLLAGPDTQVGRLLSLTAQVVRAKTSGRAAILDNWLRAAADIGVAEKRLAEFRQGSRWLRFFVYVQFVTLFAVVPALFLRLGTRAIWLVVSMLVCLSVCIALEFWHLHKRFYPESREARWQQALTIVLSPLSAIRAMDSVGRDLLAGFHPVTAAAVICEAPEFEAFAGEQLRQRNFGPAAKEWWTQAEQRALRSVVAKRGLKAEQLLTAPARQEGCDVYCPRCLAQYLAAREACSDCGYEGLVAF